MSLAPIVQDRIRATEEHELLKEIIDLKETGEPSRQLQAYEIFNFWQKENIFRRRAHSAHTYFHAAHALLLSGASIDDADTVASYMVNCADYTDEVWGDWLADTAMVSASRGDMAKAYSRLERSSSYLKEAPVQKQLRNHFFHARIELRYGDNKPYALKKLWVIRQELIDFRENGGDIGETLLRNVNWWVLVASARYPGYTVEKIISDDEKVEIRPFKTAYQDAVDDEKPWIRETRKRYQRAIFGMKLLGPVLRIPISFRAIRKG